MSRMEKDHKNQQLAAELSAEHERLERCYLDLTERAATGECRECDSVWSGFTKQLENHMAFEERDIFPRFAQKGSQEAGIVRDLLAEHAELRRQLESMGVDIQLHLTNAEVISTFLQTLRAHAAREREVLYPALSK